jgi:hypothetical protein
MTTTPAAPPPLTIDAADTDVLRRLGERVARLADDPVNAERREAWYAHDAGTGGRPMILAEIGGIRDAKKPVSDADLLCTGKLARSVEWALRVQLYQFEVLKDDHVIEPWVNAMWHIDQGDLGVPIVRHQVDAELMGAYKGEPALKDLDDDFKKLRPRTLQVDRERSLAKKAELERVFTGILGVRLRGRYWWTRGMTNVAAQLIGLEPLMIAGYDNPDGLHRLMQFLYDDHLGFARWLEKEGLLSLDNENDYCGSGTVGYTKDLPAPDRRPGQPVRLKDMWLLLESQETVGMGPQQFEEFIFPYQLRMAEHFGKCYYGCCEPVDSRIHVLKRLPNLARVSVSPWADEEVMAAELGTRYVYSRKPTPTRISTGTFDEDAIRQDIRRTLEVARGCRLELIMKDVHTLNNQPQRLPRWVQIAREECGPSAF